MYDELLNLFDDYSSINKYADEKFVNEAFKIINKYNPMGKYLKSINIVKTRSQYFPDRQIINYSLNDITVATKRLKKKISVSDHVYLYNLMVIETIFHEIEHVYQEELKLSDEMNMEKVLLVLTDPLLYISGLKENNNKFIYKLKLRYKLYKHNKYYLKHHDLAPFERIANIHACNKMIDLVDNYNIDNNGIEVFYKLISNLLGDQLLKGYKIIGDKTNNPTVDFMLGMKEPIANELINGSDYFYTFDHSFDTRVTCGLTLSSDEFEALKEKVRAIKE